MPYTKQKALEVKTIGTEKVKIETAGSSERFITIKLHGDICWETAILIPIFNATHLSYNFKYGVRTEH